MPDPTPIEHAVAYLRQEIATAFAARGCLICADVGSSSPDTISMRQEVENVFGHRVAVPLCGTHRQRIETAVETVEVVRAFARNVSVACARAHMLALRASAGWTDEGRFGKIVEAGIAAVTQADLAIETQAYGLTLLALLAIRGGDTRAELVDRATPPAVIRNAVDPFTVSEEAVAAMNAPTDVVGGRSIAIVQAIQLVGCMRRMQTTKVPSPAGAEP